MKMFAQGRSHLLGEEWPEAAAALLQATELRPEAWAVRGLLGVALLKAGRPAEAIEALTHTLQEAPDDLPARLHLGMAQLAVGQPEACEQTMRMVTAARPGEVIAWRHIARAREQQGLHTTGAWTKVARLNPRDPTAWRSLGAAWVRRGAPSPAVVCFQQVLTLRPEDLDAQLQLGTLLIDTGELEEAESLLTAVLQQVPTSAQARTALARIRSWQRRPEEARRLVKPLVLCDRPPVEAAALWAELHRQEPSAALGVVQRALAAPGSTSGRSLLLHRLGDLHDRLGAHDAAFDAWQEANQLRQLRFAPRAHTKAIQALMAAYSQPRPVSQCESDVPVFVVGMPRSGTSLLEQMLDLHPDIVGAGELESIRHIASTLSAPVDYYLRLSEIDAQTLTPLAAAYCEQLQRFGGRRVIDKMPNNFLHLGLIAQLFPPTLG